MFFLASTSFALVRLSWKSGTVALEEAALDRRTWRSVIHLLITYYRGCGEYLRRNKFDFRSCAAGIEKTLRRAFPISE
jgi:hypothetical protein